MIKVGITGQSGFIGQHLYNTLRLFPDEFENIEFHRDIFLSEEKLQNFVSTCDVIVHLAAVNRHNDPEVIYNTNLDLVNRLIAAMIATNSTPQVLFSSSSQEERDNTYGKSKKEGRELLAKWAENSSAIFTGLIIPNVFGPFGQPYYNSFIATFSHQLINDEEPKIEVDGIVKLIYINDLIKSIIQEIKNREQRSISLVSHTDEHMVSEILMLLKNYKQAYVDSGVIPELHDSFALNLFNTFRSYIRPHNYFPVKFTTNIDARGVFVEVIRLNVGGQISFSTTLPGITRGNHYHTRKIERFAVIKGNALIQLRKIGDDKTLDFHLSGEEPSYVDMPIWYTHNITNIGDEELYTIFWINEFFDPNDPDTYFETV